ncbi:MAG: hypothetical protein AB1631_17065 [Acidobacteriota bacterium]
MINSAETDARSRIAPVHRTSLIIVLAMAASTVFYVIIGLVVAPGASIDPPQKRMPLLLTALALAFASLIVRRVQFGRGRLEWVAHRRGVEALIKHFFTTTIISSALAEAIGLLALVISFLGGSQMEVISLGVIAFVMTLSNYPRRAAWEQVVDHFAATLPRHESQY